MKPLRPDPRVGRHAGIGAATRGSITAARLTWVPQLAWVLVCATPAHAAPVAADLLIVINRHENQVALIDPVALRVVKKLPTGANPHEVAVTPEGIAYVANYGTAEEPGHTLTMIDLRRRAVVRTIELGTFTRPHGMAMSRNHGSLWVASEGAGSVIEIDAATGALMQDWETKQAKSRMVVPGADERKLYVANANSGSLSVIERASGRIRIVPSGSGAEGIDYAAGRAEVWIANRESNDLVVIDARADTVLARVPNTGSKPIRLRCTPEGHEAWVANSGSNDIVVFDTATRLPLATIPVAATPAGLTIEPSGRRAFVSNSGANLITVIDVRTRKILKTFSTGREPHGLAWASGIK